VASTEDARVGSTETPWPPNSDCARLAGAGGGLVGYSESGPTPASSIEGPGGRLRSWSRTPDSDGAGLGGRIFLNRPTRSEPRSTSTAGKARESWNVDSCPGSTGDRVGPSQ
jgi:hypothetical protein